MKMLRKCLITTRARTLSKRERRGWLKTFRTYGTVTNQLHIMGLIRSYKPGSVPKCWQCIPTRFRESSLNQYCCKNLFQKERVSLWIPGMTEGPNTFYNYFFQILNTNRAPGANKVKAIPTFHIYSTIVCHRFKMHRHCQHQHHHHHDAVADKCARGNY